MTTSPLDRRGFMKQASAGAAGACLLTAGVVSAKSESTLAALGGKPVRTGRFPGWPVIEKNDRDAWMKVLNEGHWCRLDGTYAASFERTFAERMGTKHCLAIANGTSALFASLAALGVSPGDEVIVPPYTFIATIQAVMLHYAIPVFVDTDRRTSQIDANKVEAAITKRTACILPVHMGGNAADMDTLLAVGKKHSLPVLEDACQAVLGEWRGKKLGSVGIGGCFSFQASKNLNSGEGGAVISNDDAFIDKCYSFHDNARRKLSLPSEQAYPPAAANLRMTEFQASLLLSQMSRVDEQSKRRDDNAAYLIKQLKDIPGFYPPEMYPGCTRNGYHIFMSRYGKEHFANASRAQFLKALRAEGVPCSGGYTPLNRQPFLAQAYASKGYKNIFGEEYLRTRLKENLNCPENDRLCEEAVWFGQTTMLAERSDMDQIAEAIRKIHKNADQLAKL